MIRGKTKDEVNGDQHLEQAPFPRMAPEDRKGVEPENSAGKSTGSMSLGGRGPQPTTEFAVSHYA